MEVINKVPIYRGHFTIFNITVKDNDTSFEREQFHRGNSVAALVFDTLKKQFVLVKQFRVGSENYLTEIVAGTVEENEEQDKTISREITEETGYNVDKQEFVKAFYMSPGSNTEKLFLYYCEVSKKAADGGGNIHEHENIELVYLDEITDPFLFEDAKTIIAFQWWLKNKKGS